MHHECYGDKEQGDKPSVDATWIVIMEGVSFLNLCLATWMGGILVYRNQISIDIGYAGAGRWRESRIQNSDTVETEAADANELEVSQMKLLHIDGGRIVLAKTEKGFVAFEDHCTHKGGSLAPVHGFKQCLFIGAGG